MKLEEALIRLDEEELFGKVHSVDIEQSDVMKNLGTEIMLLEKLLILLLK